MEQATPARDRKPRSKNWPTAFSPSVRKNRKIALKEGICSGTPITMTLGNPPEKVNCARVSAGKRRPKAFLPVFILHGVGDSIAYTNVGAKLLQREPMTISLPRWFVFAFLCCAASWPETSSGADSQNDVPRPARRLAFRTGAELVDDAGVAGGLIVYAGGSDVDWTASLRVNERYLVQGLMCDRELVGPARQRLLGRELLGPVTIRHWPGGRLPYADDLVNLLIVAQGPALPDGEILRVLAPRGVAYVQSTDGWQKVSKPWPASIDEWTHFLHGPDNNAVANDTEVGPPRHLQWTAGPRWGRSHDQLGGVSAAVSAAGRLFAIVDEGSVASVREPARWMLVARDAFNGVLLWKRPVQPWEDHLRPFRSGPAELPRRLIAVDQRVYVTLGYGGPVTALDAATGDTIRTYEGTENAQELLLNEGRLFVVIGRPPVKEDDAPVPQLPEWLVPYPQWVYEFPPKHIVCLDAKTGERLWRRDDDQTANLLPLTMAVGEGKVFFHNERQLVALDAQTGATVWAADRPVSLHRYAWSAPTVVVSDGVVLSGDRTSEEQMKLSRRGDTKPKWLVSSGHDLFGGELIAFSADTGERLWTVPCHESFNAPVDVFVARNQVWSGQVAWTPQPGITQTYNLKTGEVVDRRPPDHEFGRFGHHRCYRAKATVNYVLHSRRGIEFVDMDSDQLLVDRWLRGTCQYGILPCNGMIYTPPHACACYVTHQLNSFNAVKRAKGDVSAKCKVQRAKGKTRTRCQVQSAKGKTRATMTNAW